MNWRNLLIAISVSVFVAGCSESGASVKIEQNEHEYAISNDVNSPSLIKLRNDRFKIVTPNLPDKVAIQVCASFGEYISLTVARMECNEMRVLKPQQPRITLCFIRATKMEFQENLKALIIDELRRLHEGVLSHYGLRPSEFNSWKNL